MPLCFMAYNSVSDNATYKVLSVLAQGETGSCLMVPIVLKANMLNIAKQVELANMTITQL